MKKNNKERRWIPYALVLIFCMGLAVIFFSPFLRGLRSFVWDTQEFGFPYINLVTRTLAEQGHLPLWNPYNFSGYAFAGDIETGMFYPVNWLFTLVSGALNFGELPFYFIFHFTFGAFFAYLLCLRLSKNVFASLLGAVTFAYNGYALGHISHLGQVTMYMWIPAVVLAFVYAMSKRQIFATLLAGATLGIALLVGHPNTSLYLIYLLGGLVLALTLADKTKWKRTLLCGISAIAFGLMVAAIMILPVMDLTLRSNRLALSYQQQSEKFSLSPSDTLGFIYPNNNHVLDPDPLPVFNGSVDITQNYLYFGLLPLFALIFAFLTKGWPKWFFGTFAILALLLGFGSFTPLNRIFFDFIPGFNKVRMAVQVMAVFFFAVSVMAALGVGKLLQYLKDKKQTVISILIGLVILSVTVVDIIGNAYNKDFYSAPKNPAQVYDSVHDLGFVAKFKEDSSPFRIHDETNAISPNKWMYYGIENIWGNGGVKLAAYNGLFMKTGRTSSQPVTDKLLDFLNVKFLITTRDLDKKHFKKIEGDIYENINVLPRAYLVKDFKIEPDVNKQLDVIKNDGIDYGSLVLLGGPPVYLGKDSPSVTGDKVTITNRNDFNLSLEVSNMLDSILVISEVYDRGWQLTVDGNKETFLLANAVFRAVPLKAGHHVVEFSYNPMPVFAGGIISVLALAMLLVAGLLAILGKSKKNDGK